MRYQGKITEWNDDRGFGFVTTNGTNERYFFHISELQGSTTRPTAGKIVTYEIVTPSDKKSSAVKVRYPGTTPARPTRAGRPWGWSPDAIIAGAHVAVPLWLVSSGKLPTMLIALIVGMSLVAFVMYNIDKRRAERDAWRIPESNLQFVGLAGGWLGALSAQRIFRHKSSKTAYVHTFRFFGVLALALMIGAARYNVANFLNGV
ncbi:MAG: hypothetical protein AzoDbin1_01395 [Azoarcus sp.]|uniref:Uncharacterized membrane protein YsdA, DUF1294 family n=1 Tax=Aromatoleum tolulyticum TaxID=34027 RepID=A0A1N7A342_9RHOO|nr:cold shock and DUF1294 domain-containing protein [Aromatoleum tolulyticum]MCK9984923.1 hypothetical protein [Azoarcus sp.]SIR33570.1 Uncharacterized membrane protein YsdA, DUF1294 family [Aromatoleum tolulyticum]